MSLLILGISAIVVLTLAAGALSPKVIPSILTFFSTNSRKLVSAMTPRNHPKAVVARALEIRDNALKRLARYELDVTLSANCPEMSNTEHAPTADFIRALRKFSQAEESIVGRPTKKTAKELLMLAMDFAHKVSKAELPMIDRVLRSGYLTESQSISFLNELGKIQNQAMEFRKLGLDVTDTMQYIPLTPAEKQERLEQKVREAYYEEELNSPRKASVVLTSHVSAMFVFKNPDQIDWSNSSSSEVLLKLNAIKEVLNCANNKDGCESVLKLYKVFISLADSNHKNLAVSFIPKIIQKSSELAKINREYHNELIDGVGKLIKIYRGALPTLTDNYLKNLAP